MPSINSPSVTELASALYRIISNNYSKADLKTCLDVEALQSIVTRPGGNPAEHRNTAILMLQKLQRSESLTAPWQVNFDSSGNIENATAAKHFIEHLFERVPIYWLAHQPLICGRTDTRRFGHLDIESHHPSNYSDWTLHILRKGEATLRWSGNETVCEEGSVVVIPPQTDCRYGLSEGTDHWIHDWFIFRNRDNWLQWLDWVSDLHAPKVVEPHEDSRALIAIAEEIIGFNPQERPIYKSLQEIKFEEMLIKVRLTIDDAFHRNYSPYVMRTQSYVLDNISQELSLEQISTQIGLSGSRLRQLFREEVGTSIMKWRDQRRMEKAAHLLKGSTLSISEIADSVGYNDPQYFSRKFKSIIGVAPSKYRR